MAFVQRTTAQPFSGIHRLRDAYPWLEDSDDEKDLFGMNHVSDIRRVDTQNATKGSFAAPIDLTKDRGKRRFDAAFSSSNDDSTAKRAKMIEERDPGHKDGLARQPIRAKANAGHSISPPPMHRSDYRRPNHSNNRPVQPDITARDRLRTTMKYAESGSRTNSNPRSAGGASATLPAPGRPPLAPAESAKIRAWAESSSICEPTGRDYVGASTACAPFLIDDDSDDDEASPTSAKDQELANKAAPFSNFTINHRRPQLSSAQRERQLLESRRRRERAGVKKGETPPSLDAREAGESKHDVMDIDSKPAMSSFFSSTNVAPIHQSGQDEKPTKRSIFDLAEIRKPVRDFGQAAKQQEQARDPRVRYSYDRDLEIEHRREKERFEVKRRKDAEKSDEKEGRNEKRVKEAEAQRAAEARRRAETEMKRRLKVEEARRQAEREKQQLAQAEEVKREAERERQERIKAKIMEDAERQRIARAEAVQRTQAGREQRRQEEAQKKLEAEQEAKAKHQEQEKRKLEQKKWEEQKKREVAQREALRKKQAAAEKEQNVSDERQAALSKLSAVRPHQPTLIEKPPAQADGAVDVNDIVAKHTAPQGLHFKDNRNDSLAANAAKNKLKDIQDRNAEDGLLQSKATHQDWQAQNERRVKAMLDRNARLRTAEKAAGEEEDQGGLVLENEDPDTQRRGYQPWLKSPEKRPAYRREKRDSRAPTPTSPLTLPQGPQSLSSPAGQALLARANTTTKYGIDRKSAEYHAKVYGRQLGEIGPEDVQLLRWKDSKMSFAEIAMAYEKTFEVAKTQGTHRKRYKQVKEAVKDAGVEEYLLDLLLSGSADAKEKVNRAMHGQWPLPGATAQKANERPRGAKGHLMADPERGATCESAKAAPTLKLPLGHGLPTPSFSTSFGTSTTEGTLEHEYDPENRPTLGGKTMNPRAMQYYFDGMAKVHEELLSDDTETLREKSPICEDDQYHFAYQVERREISQEELDDGFDIGEDDPWAICDEPLDNLPEANAKAGSEAFCIPPKWNHHALPGKPCFILESDEYDDGLAIFTTTWRGLGKAQVRVARYTRYHDDGVLPTSKDGWAPKTVYHVYERKVEKSGDDMFSEKKETDVTKGVDEAVYTLLEEANTVAIQHFVSLAYTPESGHLAERALEVKGVVEQLKKELEDEGKGEEICFRREIEAEDGTTKVEVLVKKGQLRGPRNL